MMCIAAELRVSISDASPPCQWKTRPALRAKDPDILVCGTDQLWTPCRCEPGRKPMLPCARHAQFEVLTQQRTGQAKCPGILCKVFGSVGPLAAPWPSKAICASHE